MGVCLKAQKNEKDAQFFGKVHPWDMGKMFWKFIKWIGKGPLKSKKNPQLFGTGVTGTLNYYLVILFYFFNARQNSLQNATCCMIIQINMQNCGYDLHVCRFIVVLENQWMSFSLLEVNKHYFFLFSAAGAPVDWDEIPIR